MIRFIEFREPGRRLLGIQARNIQLSEPTKFRGVGTATAATEYGVVGDRADQRGMRNLDCAETTRRGGPDDLSQNGRGTQVKDRPAVRP
ncbi:hypothetical protein GCM10027598_59260 [Amycolatopsis oliviviridis]|uniref:Uncharacterized protein n=1 Tax=Amycolatopsis oliviviridis TaxID=1471590 RepID=A0ABQ3LYR7_9PSEU|nr:hypothetical protein [Amycolatopsis oliviviridis]GHH28685.1 hypothetical protein GCM10017790_59910 [Amycolatopsis oliviviridis]